MRHPSTNLYSLLLMSIAYSTATCSFLSAFYNFQEPPPTSYNCLHTFYNFLQSPRASHNPFHFLEPSNFVNFLYHSKLSSILHTIHTSRLQAPIFCIPFLCVRACCFCILAKNTCMHKTYAHLFEPHAFVHKFPACSNRNPRSAPQTEGTSNARPDATDA